MQVCHLVVIYRNSLLLLFTINKKLVISHQLRKSNVDLSVNNQLSTSSCSHKIICEEYFTALS